MGKDLDITGDQSNRNVTELNSVSAEHYSGDWFRDTQHYSPRELFSPWITGFIWLTKWCHWEKDTHHSGLQLWAPGRLSNTKVGLKLWAYISNVNGTNPSDGWNIQFQVSAGRVHCVRWTAVRTELSHHLTCPIIWILLLQETASWCHIGKDDLHKQLQDMLRAFKKIIATF